MEPHLRSLAAAEEEAASAAMLPSGGMCTPMGGDATRQASQLFSLNWPWLAQLKSAAGRATYLANWTALWALPQIAASLLPRLLWPQRGLRRRSLFTHLFAGPAHTVTGLHYDRTANWNVQLRGEKDWVLLAAGQKAALQPSDKRVSAPARTRRDAAGCAVDAAGLRARARAIHAHRTSDGANSHPCCFGSTGTTTAPS